MACQSFTRDAVALDVAHEHVFLADTATDQWHFFQPVIEGQFSIEMEYIDIERP